MIQVEENDVIDLHACIGVAFMPVAVGWWLVVGLVVPVGVGYVLYYLVSLPMRRQERARLRQGK